MDFPLVDVNYTIISIQDISQDTDEIKTINNEPLNSALNFLNSTIHRLQQLRYGGFLHGRFFDKVRPM